MIDGQKELTDSQKILLQKFGELIDRGIKQTVKEAVQEVMQEDRKRFDLGRTLRNLANQFVKDFDSRNDVK